MTMPETAPEAHWTSRKFMYFRGMFDSRIKTGEDYPTQSLDKIWTVKPGNKAKGEGLAFIPSAYADYDGREHAAQRDRGQFIALTGDVDSGDHDLGTIREAVTALIGDAAWLIYSSAHARPGDMRWRIILPLAEVQGFDAWHDAQLAFFAYMEARGIAMDYAMARAAQPVYLPNVPATHSKSDTPLRGNDGQPLYFAREGSPLDAPGLDLTSGLLAQGIAAIRHQRIEDEKARERIRQEAEAKRANKPRTDGASLIEDFNANNTVATMLELCGYEQSPRNADDWRSPLQSGDTYATRVIGEKWVSLSASDAAAGLGERCKSGCYGDAYDLFVHFKHGGDHKAAFRALHAERRAAQPNVIYLDPPEWVREVPPYTEMPEWADRDEDEPEIIDHVDEPAQEELHTVDAFDFDEAAIPPRPWIIPGAMLAGYTHILAAPGGSGKSLFTLQLTIALARGEAWGGFHPRRRAKSLIINVEDDLHEQRRRLAAARRVMPGAGDLLRGMVHLVDSADSIVVAKTDERSKSTVTAPIVDVLRRYILDNQIDVLIVDPFAETFEGDENDNSQVKWAMKVWRDDIARATGCAVYLVHHTTKHASNGAGDANVIRGAGAIVNSTRISATLMPMTPDDAQAIGIEPNDRHLYVRYDDAKANQSIKSGQAKWFRKESVKLDNGTDSNPADEVGALVPWSPPDAFDGVTSQTISRVLETLHAGLPSGARYTASTKGGSVKSGKWAGCVLMELAGVKEGVARKIIGAWLHSGVLVEDEYHCPEQRKQKMGVFAPLESRPGDVF